jgi:hypothetical protein
LTNGNFLNGETNWRTDYGDLIVTDGVAIQDAKTDGLAIVSNNSYTPATVSHEIYVKVTENLQNKDLDIGFATDGISPKGKETISACPLGINHVTVTAVAGAVTTYVFPKITVDTHKFKIDFVVVRTT